MPYASAQINVFEPGLLVPDAMLRDFAVCAPAYVFHVHADSKRAVRV